MKVIVLSYINLDVLYLDHIVLIFGHIYIYTLIVLLSYVDVDD